MTTLSPRPEPGDEGRRREALPRGEALDVARRFGLVVDWQVDHRVARVLAVRLTTEPGARQLYFETSVTYLLDKLWRRPKPPRQP